MGKIHVRVVGGWCGNRMIMVAEHLENLMETKGYACRLTTQSIWENPAPPQYADLVLQLMPVFTAKEVPCRLITVKPLIADLNHPETLQKIVDAVAEISASTSLSVDRSIEAAA